MGNSVCSPGPNCLPKPNNEFFYIELVEKGVYYRNAKDDYMWEVKLPDGWGYLPGESSSTYWGGTIETGKVIDENGWYVAEVRVQSSGRDDKEGAWGSISKTNGRIKHRFTVDVRGYVTINQNDVILEEQEKKQKEEAEKESKFQENMRKIHLRRVEQHNENVSRYQECATLYQEKLNSLDKQSHGYEKYVKIYSNNLKNEFDELKRRADVLQLPSPLQIELTI